MELGVKRSSVGQDDQSWLGSAHGTDAPQTITLDTTSFTAAEQFTDNVGGWLKSGLPLAQTGTEDGQRVYGLWTTGATLAGFLFTGVQASADRVGGAILEHGRVKTAKLPVAVDAAGQTSAAGRIIFA